MLLNYQQIHNSYASLSAIVCLFYFAAIKMQVHISALLLIVGGARQVLISREITLRHKELKIARLTLICNSGKSLYFLGN